MLQQRSFNSKNMQFSGISNIVAVFFSLALKRWKKKKTQGILFLFFLHTLTQIDVTF